MAFLIGGANSAADTGYDIENSCRFYGDTDLKRLPSSTGQSVRGTLSVWVKFCTADTEMAIMGGWDNSGANDDDGYLVVKRLSTGELQFNGGDDVYLKTNARYRDVSAWYHIVLGIDSAQNSNNSQRLYVNGSEVTSFATRNNLSNLQDLPINTTAGNDDALLIGCDEDTGGKGLHFNGYMSEFFWIDSTQYAASNFGETNDDGIWIPKTGSDIVDDLTMGTNGVFLEFKESGTGADSSGIGADTGGSDLHFTVTNLAAIDQCTDTPTNNFCTWNPLYKNSSNPAYTPSSFSEGNLKLTLQNDSATIGTIGLSKGKWYYEYKFAESTADNQNYPTTGYTTNSHTFSAANMVGRATPSDSNYDGSTVYRGQMGSTVISAQVFLGYPVANDIIGWYLDLDNETLIAHKNGSTFMGASYTSGIDWSSGLSTNDPQDGFFYPSTRNNGHGTVGDQGNFGNSPFSLSSAVSDANGYGSFEYNPTIGGVNYYAICTKNLAKYG